MGSVDDVLTAMLSDDRDHSSLAAVKGSSNSLCRVPNDVFASLPFSNSLHGSLTGPRQQPGLSKSSNFSGTGLDRSLAQIPEWPFPRDEKWGLDVLQEPGLTRATNFNPNMIAPQNMKTSRQGGLQRYHSAPSSFLQCLDDFINEPGGFPQTSSPMPDSNGLLTWADNLAPIMERCSQHMDTEKIYPSSELNDYEEFIATLTDFSTISPSPESQKDDAKESLIRQDGLGGFVLPAIQDNMEESSDVTFQMPGFLPKRDSLPGSTSEENGVANNSKSSTYTSEDCTYLIKETGGLWNCPTNPGKLGGNIPSTGEEGTIEPPPDWSRTNSFRTTARVGEEGPKSGGLIRHSSLPAPSRPFSGNVDFDDLFADPSGVPLKTMRANRGHATHPRSIAERVRRGKISERMKKLQELVPNMDRQTNTADMLDDAVEYVKQLQQQVQELSKTVAELQQLQERLGRRD